MDVSAVVRAEVKSKCYPHPSMFYCRVRANAGQTKVAAKIQLLFARLRPFCSCILVFLCSLFPVPHLAPPLFQATRSASLLERGRKEIGVDQAHAPVKFSGKRWVCITDGASPRANIGSGVDGD